MDERLVRVALTREVGHNEELRAWLPDEAEVVEVPLTETRFVDGEFVDEQLDELRARHDWRTIVVSSARAARFVPHVLARVTAPVEVMSVGPSTTRALADLGVAVAVQSLGGAVELSGQVRDGAVLLIGAASMRPELAEALRATGRSVDVVSVYHTESVDLSDQRRDELGRCDVVVIGAPSAWAVARGFVRADAWVVVPGATTARAVRADHDRVITGWDASLRERLSSTLRGGVGDDAQ